MTNRPIQILIIEDDIDYVDIVRMCLDESDAMGMKFELEYADRLELGLKMLESAPFDALLLDLMLPDSRGIDTIIQVLSRGCELPILVMTNVGDESVAFEAMRLGAQDFMVKETSDSRFLKRAIWYAIERHKLRAQSENMIKKAADGMVVVDMAGNVQYVNPAAEALFGLQAQSLLGQPFAYPASAGQTSLFKIPRAAGEEKTTEMRVTEIQWKDTPALLASIRDVTDLQRVEQLKAEIKERRKLDALKDEFIGNVSHELRTPLAIVKGAIDNVREGLAGPMPAKQKEIMDLAHRNLARLAKMIDNLLDLSRLESGRARANRRRLSLPPLIEEAIGGFHLVAEEQKMALEADIAPDLPEVYADGDMLAQVLGNLLDNALRFARTRVKIRASGAQAPDGGRGVLVEVADDGPGIPPDKVGDLFNKFVQVNRKPGRGYKGTGLGLTICREIMTLHGSKIAVESAPGQGARFYFVLPESADIPSPAGSQQGASQEKGI